MSTRAERASKRQNERHAAILRELLKQPSNKKCADCKRNDPRWASWNLGIFICIRCSGVHRSMGTHISKVKSVDLDTWTPDQIENMKKWGNYKANLYWEATLTDKDKFQENNFERWIRAKYEMKRFVKSNDIPDPDTLPNENGESKVSTSTSKQSAKPLVSTEEVQGVFSTSSSKKPSNTSASNSNQDIFLFQDFANSTSNNNSSSSSLNAAFTNTTTTSSPAKPANTNESLKSSILSLYNTPSPKPSRPATNNFPSFGNTTSMNPSTGMPLAFQASPMQSGSFGSPMQPSNTGTFGSPMQPMQSNTMGLNSMMQPQSTGFGSPMQPSNNSGFSNTSSGFSSTMQPSKPAPKHDPFDFISISSFSNNPTKTTNNPTTTTNNKNNNANDDFADFQTASNGNSNWANF